VSAPRVAVCIPTKDRAESVRRLLVNLRGQDRPADVVLVVDSSTTDATKLVCDEVRDGFGDGVVRYERCEAGLPLQRLRGIELLRATDPCTYLCFLDDDVVLEGDYIERILAFMESPAGSAFAGVSGYDLENWGKPAQRLDRWFTRAGVLDPPSVPGRWFYCGYVLELDYLTRSGDVHETDFLPGFQAVWRAHVFDEFLPPADIPGYALGEDKHLSLRVRSKHRLAIFPGAGVRHLHAPGGRPERMKLAFQRVRANVSFVRDCDPHPTVRRVAACIGFHMLEALAQVCVRLVRGRFADVGESLASLAGALSCIVTPPRRSAYALGGNA
jgi:GT2 family glycosyltransferase